MFIILLFTLNIKQTETDITKTGNQPHTM